MLGTFWSMPLVDWDLALTLDRAKAEPLYLQLVRALEEGIRKGRFRPGQALPGTRALAGQVGVNRNTILAAYRELTAQGWLEAAPDKGTYVAMELPAAMEEEAGIAAADSASWKRPSPPEDPFYRPAALERDAFRLIPDLPDLRNTPTAAIQRAYSRVLRLHHGRLLQAAWDPRGLLELRLSLCKMIRDMRGLAVAPGNLLLTRGLMSTLNLVSRTLFAPGDGVAVEDAIMRCNT